MDKPEKISQKPRRGRPPHLPEGSRRQAYRGTDEEHAELMAVLKRMRARRPRKPKP